MVYLWGVLGWLLVSILHMIRDYDGQFFCQFCFKKYGKEYKPFNEVCLGEIQLWQ